MSDENTVSSEETIQIPEKMAEFITAWQGSDSVAEVAAKTGKAAPSCSTLASNYRASVEKGGYGIPLKRMGKGPRGGKKTAAVDVQAFFAGLSTPHKEARETLGRDME